MNTKATAINSGVIRTRSACINTNKDQDPQILKWGVMGGRGGGVVESWRVCFLVYYAVRIGDKSNW